MRAFLQEGSAYPRVISRHTNQIVPWVMNVGNNRMGPRKRLPYREGHFSGFVDRCAKFFVGLALTFFSGEYLTPQADAIILIRSCTAITNAG
jgi:hypothetical protein